MHYSYTNNEEREHHTQNKGSGERRNPTASKTGATCTDTHRCGVIQMTVHDLLSQSEGALQVSLHRLHEGGRKAE